MACCQDIAPHNGQDYDDHIQDPIMHSCMDPLCSRKNCGPDNISNRLKLIIFCTRIIACSLSVRLYNKQLLTKRQTLPDLTYHNY